MKHKTNVEINKAYYLKKIKHKGHQFLLHIFYVYNMKTIFNSTKIQTTLPLININQQRRPSLAAFRGELLIHTSNNRVHKNRASRKKSSPLPAINHFFCTCTQPKLNSPPSETKTTCINTTHAHRTRAKETSRRFAQQQRKMDL